MMFRAAVIGLGRMGYQTPPNVLKYAPKVCLPTSHTEAISEHPKFNLCAICDSSPDSLTRASEFYSDALIFTDYKDLLSIQGLDFISIATRTLPRFDIIKFFASKGVRHFHVEKPLCNSVEQLDYITKLVNNLKLHLTIGSFRRYLQPYIQAKSLLASGLIGSLNSIDINLGHSALCWTHPHSFDLIDFFLSGRIIASVYASAEPESYRFNGFNLDGDPIINYTHFTTTCGVIASVTSNPGCDVVLYGELGIIRIRSDGASIYVERPYPSSSPYFSSMTEYSIGPYLYGGTTAAIARHTDSLNHYDSFSVLASQRMLFSVVYSLLSKGAVDYSQCLPALSINGRSGSLFA